MVTSPDAPRTKAFSYIRMSSDAQLKGDSLRRQLEISDKYIADNGLELVERLSDLGVSAFRGANVEYGALGRFLQAVREGKVEPGSYLIVEALDRISRQPTRIALQLFLELMNSGIVVVTLSNNQVYTTESYDTQQLIISIIEMSRAAEESGKKSFRVSQAWQNKRNAISTQKLTRRGPAWLRLPPGQQEFEAIPERVAVIRRIFDETVSGIGAFTIACRLNDDKVPTFGKSKTWQPSSVNKIVASSAVIGEFQLHEGASGTRIPYGPPIKGYFPSVISDDLFYAAQASRLSRRKVGGGRKGKYVSNLFAKIVYCSYCGSRMLFEDKGGGPKGGIYFVCMSIPTGSNCVRTRWRYDHFEASFLAFVEELDLGSIFSIEEDAAKRAAIGAEISSLGGQLQLFEQQRDNIFALTAAKDMNVSYVSGKMRDCEAQITQTEAKIDAARTHLASMSAAAAGYYESRDQIKELIGRVKTKSADNYKTRAQIALRLKSLIVRIDVASVGIMPNFEKFVEWSKLNGYETIAEEGNLAQLRFFSVVFRDGTCRRVYPSAHDPLQFEHQFYTDSEQQSKLIRFDDAEAPIRWLDPIETKPGDEG
jgi:DNA invertase Pin-like site-specific DNA recombinase